MVERELWQLTARHDLDSQEIPISEKQWPLQDRKLLGVQITWPVCNLGLVELDDAEILEMVQVRANKYLRGPVVQIYKSLYE
jgi:hypothetical protein